MKQKTRRNFFILTGGPGAGKSSVLEELHARGHATVPEVGRKIIKEQLAQGGNATHMGDRIAFRDLMLKYSIDDFIKHLDTRDTVFFDRGIPDILGYSELISATATVDILDAVRHYRYNTVIFTFPPWAEIYAHDEERKQDFQEVIKTYQCIRRAYSKAGYNLIEMPKTDVISRADFIIQCLLSLKKS